MIVKNANQIRSGEWVKENKNDKFNQVIAVIKVHEPHGKPWGVWQHTLVVNSLMCNETIQISRRKSLALR